MELLEYINLSLPMVSSLTCGILFVVAYVQKLTIIEQQIKKILAIYFACMTVYWLYVQVYPVYGFLLVFFIPLICCVLQLLQVIFYHFISLLTPLDEMNIKNINFHYFMPLSFLLVTGGTMIYFVYLQWPKGAISSFFKPYIFLSTLIFILFYTILECIRIIRYKKRLINNYGAEKWLNMRWLEIVTVMKIIFIITFAFNRLERGEAFFILAILMCVQQIILVYNILMRNYRILSSFDDYTMMIIGGKIISLSDRPIKANSLISREELEAYYKNNKPYLDPAFRINDLADYFGINRTYMSGFINKTFGVNFSQYNNLWRLKEVEYLQQCRGYEKNMSQTDLAMKAGFNSSRSYWRAKKLYRKN